MPVSAADHLTQYLGLTWVLVIKIICALEGREMLAGISQNNPVTAVG